MRGRLEHVQKQQQRLILSKEMQKALHVLQLPVLELSSLIATEIEQNPILEYAEDDFLFSFSESIRKETSGRDREETDYKSFLENTIGAATSLFDHLLNQASEKLTPDKLPLAKLLIGNLDDNGFLTAPLEEIAFFAKCPIDNLEPILAEIKTFDPIGVGAKNLAESLLIQLKAQGKEKGPAYKIVENHFEDMLKNRLPLIGKNLSLPPYKVKEIIEKEIVSLNLHPGKNLPRNHYQEITHFIVPDVTINDDLTIVVNEEKIPNLRFNSQYLNFLEDKTLPKEAKDFIKEKIQSGKWFLRNLSERNTTLYRISEAIAKKQKHFFLETEGKLLPFTMKEVANHLGLHESTVVRAVSNKYLNSPRGLYPLRFFFTHSAQENVSSHTIQDTIVAIIAKENKKAPLSDEDISALLKTKGFSCARRTVAKYRTLLKIGNTTERKLH